MSDSFFRPEAVAHQKETAFGTVLLLQPLSFKILTAIAVFIAAMIVALFIWGSYTQKETVMGYLVPDKGLVRMYAPYTSIVESIDVKESQHVKEGQVLWTGRQEHWTQGQAGLERSILDNLRGIEQRSEQKIVQEEELYVLQLSQYQEQEKALAVEVAQLKQQLTMQEERISLAKNRAEKLKDLHSKGFAAQSNYEEAYEHYLTQQQYLDELLHQIQNKEAQKADVASTLAQMPLLHEKQLSDLKNTLADVQQRAYELSSRYDYAMISPIDGEITALQLTPGQSVEQNQLGLVIMPSGYQLFAKLFVPTSAAAFIEVGQTVYIRYSAFPYEKYGLYHGKVVEISKTILFPNEITVPIALNESVYCVTVAIDEQSVRASGHDFPLQSGMQLEADIIIGKKTLMEWILAPIYRFKGRI
ncbi:MAG: HlyD family efflux transporter periplasmic adaptor subunit [Pseudomonadota bacterium]